MYALYVCLICVPYMCAFEGSKVSKTSSSAYMRYMYVIYMPYSPGVQKISIAIENSTFVHTYVYTHMRVNMNLICHYMCLYSNVFSRFALYVCLICVPLKKAKPWRLLRVPPCSLPSLAPDVCVCVCVCARAYVCVCVCVCVCIVFPYCFSKSCLRACVCGPRP